MHHFSANNISHQNTDLMAYANTKCVYIVYACYNEILVMLILWHQKQTYYKITVGIQIVCNKYLPVAFCLDSEYYGVAPTLREIKKPQTLKSSTSWTWNYKSPKHLMIAGIYSQDTMAALQKHLLLPQEIQIAQKI